MALLDEIFLFNRLLVAFVTAEPTRFLIREILPTLPSTAMRAFVDLVEVAYVFLLLVFVTGFLVVWVVFHLELLLNSGTPALEAMLQEKKSTVRAQRKTTGSECVLVCIYI